MLDAKAQGWEDKGDRAVLKVGLKDGSTASIDCDKILVTVGRRPNTDTSGFANLGVKTDQRGFIITDRQLRTNVPNHFAAGDCATGLMLAHKASKEGEVIAEVIAGKKAEQDARTIPAVVFTDPEIASAGLTEAEAKATGRKIKIGKYPFSVLGRALSVNEPEGFAKIIADAETEVVLGVHIVGPNAAELISEAALAIEMGAVLHDIALTVHPHPSLPEAIMEAAKHALGEAIHILNK
jgi:dihydrolipoamide dehydrogenase